MALSHEAIEALRRAAVDLPGLAAQAATDPEAAILLQRTIAATATFVPALLDERAALVELVREFFHKSRGHCVCGPVHPHGHTAACSAAPYLR